MIVPLRGTRITVHIQRKRGGLHVFIIKAHLGGRRQRQLGNPHQLLISCKGKKQLWSTMVLQPEPPLKVFETKRPTPSTFLSPRVGCHSGSWNHICYLYVPLGHPALYFWNATVVSLMIGFWNGAEHEWLRSHQALKRAFKQKLPMKSLCKYPVRGVTSTTLTFTHGYAGF